MDIPSLSSIRLAGSTFSTAASRMAMALRSASDSFSEAASYRRTTWTSAPPTGTTARVARPFRTEGSRRISSRSFVENPRKRRNISIFCSRPFPRFPRKASAACRSGGTSSTMRRAALPW
jgi:hypothetical protein